MFLSLFSHYQPQKYATAASPLTMLLALSVLVGSASPALAQMEETTPPVLSSGLRQARSAQTPGTERPSYGRATQALSEEVSLPPIASIGAGSDIRPFLAPGVPGDLTRAALRRAWSTDPAIRDFVGLSEDSADLNASGLASGFGAPITHDPAGSSARLTEEPKNRESSVSHQTAAPPNELGR
jgi:hypothetical protein